MNYINAALIGAVSGLRAMSAPALIARQLGSERAWHITAALAVTELIADKLPFMPDRTQPGALALRALSGAVCGYALAASRGSKRKNRQQTTQEKWMSALVAGTAALAAAFAGNQFRRRVRLPHMISALLEDAVAVGSGAAVAGTVGH